MARAAGSSGIPSSDWLPDGFGHPWPAGTLLDGGYRIERVLGRGGFAVVYEALHPELGVVAVKVLDLALQGDLAADARFVREAEMAARVAHPNVLRVHHLGRAPDGAPFLVMELLLGEDLSDLLERERVSVPAAVEIGIQLCGALAVMAELGVLHRDLKPHNVLMHRQGDVIRPKLIDFGIATCTSGSLANARRLTRTGIVMGTPHYLSPEQARGDELDIRADLYSLGVLLYEAVCGRAPFEEGNLSALLASVLRDERPPITDFYPECPPGFAAILDKTIRRERDERFASPEHLADALARFAASEGLPRGDAALASLQIAAKTTLPWELRSLARCEATADSQPPPVLDPTLGLEKPPSNPPPSIDRVAPRPPTLAPAPEKEPNEPTRSRRVTLVAAVAAAAGLSLAIFSIARGPTAALASAEKASTAEPTMNGTDHDPTAPVVPDTAVASDAAVANDGATERPEPMASGALEANQLGEPRAPKNSEPRLSRRPPPHGTASARALARQAQRAYVRGRLGQARTLYARATRSDPSYAGAWRGYGLVTARMGRSAEAKWALRRYLRLAPRTPDAAAVRQTIASLR